MTEPLAPCPFCGSSVTIKDDSEACGMPTFILTCDNKECWFANAEDDADVLRENWNRRAEPAPDEVRKAMEMFIAWDSNPIEDGRGLEKVCEAMRAALASSARKGV